jgi:ABC-type transporter Mla subunit MlaD
MSDSKNPRPNDVRAAAQAALQAAQDAAAGAMRVPTASAQILGQLPELIENLATATERLNTTLDRFERYIALADPTLQALDRILPQLQALAATGDAAFRAVGDLPGVGTFGRITGLTPREAPPEDKGKTRKRRGPSER